MTDPRDRPVDVQESGPGRSTSTESELLEGTALLDGTYIPSPIPRIRDQVEAYERSGGTKDNTLEGKPVVILTTVGAKSLLVRKNPVMRIADGESYLAVASAAGAAEDPQWYRNLRDHPVIRLQDGSDVSVRVARELHGDEKTHWWQVAETFWPHFPEYRAKANGREIPIVLLDRPGVRLDSTTHR